MISMVVSAVAFLILLYVLYVRLDLGLEGVCIATGLMYLVRFVCSSILICMNSDLPKHDDVYLFSTETCTNVMPLLKKSLSSAAYGVWGAWSTNILVLSATYLGTAGAAAYTIMVSIIELVDNNTASICQGSQIVAAKSIGQRKTRLALQYYTLGFIYAMASAVAQIGILWVFCEQILDFYEAKEETNVIVRQNWLIFHIYVLVNAVQLMSNSFVRAAGKQYEGSFLTLAG
mmetsp:Transcript_8438/g.11635  ORF Transcript_8438/g.11635 Transcript_8438/m.11635 type:complete len:231 (-) Transcript_8438:283-975(-)